MEKEMIERVARAIEKSDLGYRMELTRLVDGESTYTLWIEGDEPREFPDTDELYVYLRERKRLVQARAVIEAMREPTEAMVDTTGELGVPDEHYRDIWRQMIDAALGASA